jgi:hypothetical protein
MFFVVEGMKTIRRQATRGGWCAELVAVAGSVPMLVGKWNCFAAVLHIQVLQCLISHTSSYAQPSLLRFSLVATLGLHRLLLRYTNRLRRYPSRACKGVRIHQKVGKETVAERGGESQCNNKRHRQIMNDHHNASTSNLFYEAGMLAR